MEVVGPRPWWRLEPEPGPSGPTEIGPELVEHHRAHYRDRAAVDSLMWSKLDDLGDREPRGPDPRELGGYDPYGTPLTEEAGHGESWTGWFNSCLERSGAASGVYREWFLSVAEPQLLARFTDDEAMAGSIGPSPRGVDQPGTLIGVRHRGMTSFFEGVSNLADRTNTIEHQVWSVGVGLRVYDGQLFWLPDPFGGECLTSEAPDPDLMARIRLPFESVLVGLASPVPAAALGAGEDETWRIAMAPGGEKAALEGEPHLAAVWLAAGGDGMGVAPVVVWFVETAGGISAVPGVWERSAYAGAVANLGAVLTWENWVEPPSPPEALGPEGSRERRKALKKSAVRKAIARGALHKVRVLVIPAAAKGVPAEPDDEEGPGRRSPIRHWRRGHWRKVRVSMRDVDDRIIGSTSGVNGVDWAYEGRWIRPVLVNPQGPADPGAKVYKQVAGGQ